MYVCMAFHKNHAFHRNMLVTQGQTVILVSVNLKNWQPLWLQGDIDNKTTKSPEWVDESLKVLPE